MRCLIWYHLYNLKNVKNTHGGVLILVKLQLEATFKAQFMKKLSNSEAEFKKSVAYKKSVFI